MLARWRSVEIQASQLCFNGAAALRPRKRLRQFPGEQARQVLQWGRGFEAAETDAVLGDGKRDKFASMGPRL